MPDIPAFDQDAFDAWIDANLRGDDERNPRWAVQLIPERAKTVGAIRGKRELNILVTNRFAHDLAVLAKERGLTRAGLIRLILVDAVHRMTQRDRDEILADMPPRRPNPIEYEATA